MSAIELSSVSCWYGDVVAVNDVTMTIGPGVTGLLGPNGAGKTTLIQMMGGFLKPSTGSVTLDTRPIWGDESIYRTLGLVPEREAAYDFLTGSQFARLNAELHGMDAPGRAAARALAVVEMTEFADRAIGTYSKGMRQRVKMAAALVHDPSVLLLDEPFNGMDPRQRLHLMALIRRMGSEGKTVLFSSHILEEVEQVATQIEVMVTGRHAATGDFRRIRALMVNRPHQFLIRSDDDRALASALMSSSSVTSVEMAESGGQPVLRTQVVDFAAFVAMMPVLTKERGIRLRELRPTDESLESVFGYLISGQAGVRR